MDRALIERLQAEMRKTIQNAARYHDSGDDRERRAAVETAISYFEWMQREGYCPPAGELDHLQGVLRSLGYGEEEAAELVLSKKKKQKLDLKGKSSGGSEHKRKKRPSTKGKHQKGRATERQSYGGEKGDISRRYPRKKWKGYKGPWPPPEETETPPHREGEAEGPSSGTGEGLGYEGGGKMTGQELYEKAEQLAREADRNGGPLPVTLLQEAAAAGYPPAIYALANWHLHGKGVKKNYKQAVALLKRAATKKYPAAEYDLAASYEVGKGTRRDPKAALIWYRRAANDGDTDAPAEVARFYYHGIGTRQDLRKAVEWYRKAAERGDTEAQYALGRAYELGEGVEPNAGEAMRWYEKAAMRGDEGARKALADLRSQYQ